VVDGSLSVVASNAEVLQILTFPDRPEKIHNLESWLANKIRSNLMERRSRSGLVGEFQSARRTYLCRSFPLDLAPNHKNGSGGLLIGGHDCGNIGALRPDGARAGNGAIPAGGFYQQGNCAANEDQPEYGEGIYSAGDGEDERLDSIGDYRQDCGSESLKALVDADFGGANDIGLVHLETCGNRQIG
jgi:hypothetical protein